MISTLAVDDPRWMQFVDANPEATPFHDRPWISVVSECYGFRPLVVAMSHGSEIVAAVPVLAVGPRWRRRWVSLPFTDRCGPLSAGADPVQLAQELDQARRTRALRSIELREKLDSPAAHVTPCGHWHELPLSSDLDDVRRLLHRQRRQRLNRSIKNGVVVERGTSEADLCEVFFQMHVATRHRLGVPVQPLRLFKLLYRRVIEPGFGFVLVARVDEVPIAAGVFLTGHGRIVTKFSATDREYAKIGGMDAVYWEAMRSGCEAGYSVFDFGRTEHGNEGLREFKLSWGSTEHSLGYTVFSEAQPTPGHGRIEATLGSAIRKSPAWVARLVGEVAYRFAA